MAVLVNYKHQTEAEEQTWEREYAALLMEMGLGKSRVLLRTAMRLFAAGKINALVVVAPKSICRTWLDEQIPTHLECKYEAIVWAQNTKQFTDRLYHFKKPIRDKLQVLIINVETIASDRCYDFLYDFFKSHNALFAVDESGTIKNHKAQRTKAVINLGRHAKYRRILNGAPITQGPLDAYSQFDFLKYGCLGSFSWFGFRNQYAALKDRYINGRRFKEIVGYQRLQELKDKVAELSYRATKAQCLDLPEKIYTIRYIEMTPKQLQYYHQMRQEALVIFKNEHTIAAPLAITQILRLRQSLVNLVPAGEGATMKLDDKDPRMEELLDVLLQAGDQKVIIFANFVSTIKMISAVLKKELGRDVGVVSGDIPAEQRQHYIKRFQEEKNPDHSDYIKHMVLQTRTGGFGITLTEASVVVYYDHDWSLETRLQSEDRAHRIGQTRNVTYIDFVARGTVEEKIRDALMSKKDVADIVTGDKICQLLEG